MRSYHDKQTDLLLIIFTISFAFMVNTIIDGNKIDDLKCSVAVYKDRIESSEKQSAKLKERLKICDDWVKFTEK